MVFDTSDDIKTIRMDRTATTDTMNNIKPPTPNPSPVKGGGVGGIRQGGGGSVRQGGGGSVT